MKLPNPVPELPVSNLQASGTFYEQRMGFHVDWVYEDYLAGISKDAARIFLRRKTEQEEKHDYNVLVWLNLNSPLEVDQLHDEWKRSGVDITDQLETNLGIRGSSRPKISMATGSVCFTTLVRASRIHSGPPKLSGWRTRRR